MKYLIVISIIVISGLAGYLLHKPATITEKKTEFIVMPDTITIRENESLRALLKAHILCIDSLEKENIKLKAKHEKDIADVDTLAAPVLFGKIAGYFVHE
jgi:hypothetical protein